ncbi:unnamed protein product, partial [Polarella glacialis]
VSGAGPMPTAFRPAEPRTPRRLREATATMSARELPRGKALEEDNSWQTQRVASTHSRSWSAFEPVSQDLAATARPRPLGAPSLQLAGPGQGTGHGLSFTSPVPTAILSAALAPAEPSL